MAVKTLLKPKKSKIKKSKAQVDVIKKMKKAAKKDDDRLEGMDDIKKMMKAKEEAGECMFC